jgi:hypothetical protein
MHVSPYDLLQPFGGIVGRYNDGKLHFALSFRIVAIAGSGPSLFFSQLGDVKLVLRRDDSPNVDRDYEKILNADFDIGITPGIHE